ncbi:hypothetical protein [Neisseria sp. S1]|uniref:hypothetical protein n=1 Tax=Neisseria sp. S1 TaxID=3318354 RepID=UPI003A8B852B
MDTMQSKDQAVAHALNNWDEYEKRATELNDSWVRANIAKLPPEEKAKAEKLHAAGHYNRPKR